AVGFDDDVVGAVEPLAIELLGDRGPRAIIGDPADPASIVLGRQDAPLAIERQAIGHAASIGGELGPLGQPAPPRDALVRNIAEEQTAAPPYRSLREPQAAGYPLDGGVRVDEIVETGVVGFQRCHGGQLLGRSSEWLRGASGVAGSPATSRGTSRF